MIDIGQYSEYILDSEYATVLKMLRLHKFMNKVFPSYIFDRVLNMSRVLNILELHRVL